jgi:hypothetical protein
MILKYVLVNNDGIVNEANLAYRPANDGNRVSDIIDAKTGQFLDWQGKPLTAQPRSYHFTDIAGLEAEKEITALGQAGIFGEYGDLSSPLKILAQNPSSGPSSISATAPATTASRPKKS